VKVPDVGLPPKGERRIPQQLAFRASLIADPVGGTAELRSPRMELSAFVGDLHLEEGVPQNVYSLDPTGLDPVRTTGAGGSDQLIQAVDVGPGPGGTVTGLPNGMTLTVDGVRDWAVFATKHDPGKELVLASAVLLLIGLVLTLTIRRRRVWVRAVEQPADGQPADDRAAAADGPGGGQRRTLVEVGGVARSGDLSAEFDELVGRLQDRLPPEERETRVESQ
jgi:cytochrome c biogenesis protein